MSNNKSKIVISTIIITATLGFLGFRICRRKKSIRELKVQTPANSVQDKIEVNDIIAVSPTSAEELLYKISKEILEKKSFNTSEELFSSVIHDFIVSYADISWLDELPNTLEKLEDFFREHGLYGRYLDTIQEIKNKDRN